MKPTPEEYINKAKYDAEGQIIFRVSKDDASPMPLLDVRGWGAIQNLFKNEKDAAEFQDSIGEYIADAINEKLSKPSQFYSLQDVTEFAEWIELEGYRIKGMDQTQRDKLFALFLESRYQQWLIENGWKQHLIDKEIYCRVAFRGAAESTDTDLRLKYREERQKG